ncbi:hypothetical protein PHYSODRAFT_249285 [Phytophthora sojae]|uniref:Uncharacterized protein n=1 Tax=Phytophthora sojae (strain P6497) TaxID=1094619 RepID=G4YJ95_PHYSP|nr:hypothetical protein PHYSODRAFT_249285 [Phytophthora sojae]EGZ29429.1 hypothetical protein PHYSODRAFT_249285 [Phytophthora sojae]|eukprot:XP_009516704.1 hypothetical protein PHYSODRAFT_249285 [Phytophthora sojae]
MVKGIATPCPATIGSNSAGLTNSADSANAMITDATADEARTVQFDEDDAQDQEIVRNLAAELGNDTDDEDQAAAQGERPPLIPRATRNADTPSANKVLGRLGEEMRAQSEWMMMFAPVAMAQARWPVLGPELTQPVNSTDINQLVEDTVLLLKAMRLLCTSRPNRLLLGDWDPSRASREILKWKRRLRVSFGLERGAVGTRQTIAKRVADTPKTIEDPSRIPLPKTPERKRAKVFRSTEGTPYFEDSHMKTPTRGKQPSGRYAELFDAADAAKLSDSDDGREYLNSAEESVNVTGHTALLNRGTRKQLAHRRASRRVSTSTGSMPPKRSARSAKAPPEPRAVGPKTRTAKAKDESSALMEATKAAEEVVRSRSSTPESGRQAGARSKSPDAAQGKEESPRGHKSPVRDWEAAVFDCTMVQYSGESSPDDENVSEGSTHAAEGTELAAGDMTNASADAKASSEKEAEDAESGSGDSKQSHDEVAMADAGVVAEKSPSDAGSKPKEVLASKHLTLAQGRERAQASKAAAGAKAAEAKAKKRSASRSPRGSSSKLFIDSESEDEEGSPIESSSGGDATYPQGYFPPEPGTGAPALLEKLSAPRGLIGGYTSRGSYERALVEKEPLFLGDVEVARCVLLAPHKLTLKEFTTLRKKPEDKGGLHPVWGFHWVKSNDNMTWSEVEDLFWRYVQRKGYSDQEFEELREDRTLSAILDVRELRIEFAQLVSKRKLHSKMDELKRGESKSSGSAHYDQGGPAVASHGHGYEPEATQPYAGASSQVVALQQEKIRLLRERVYVLEIALGVGLGGEAAARAGQPGAVERLREDVASLYQEARSLHGRVDRRADLSSYDSLQNQLAGLRAELHGHAPYPEQQQPHSYQAQFGQGSYGAPAYAAPM